MADKTILQEAESLINGDRKQTYGDARESFERIAGMWSAYLGTEVTGLDVTNMMILLKVSRAKGGFHRDSYVDIGGYAGLSTRIVGVLEAPEMEAFLAEYFETSPEEDG